MLPSTITFSMTVPWDPLHPGFEHAEEKAPDYGHITDVLLQDLFGLPVDVKAFSAVEFLTTFFEEGIELGVGPGLTPAAGEFSIEGIVVLVVRVRIISKPANQDELQIELPQPLTEHALFEDFEFGIHF